MLTCGKYRGERFADVAREYRSYCAWVMRDGGPGFVAFASYLRGMHGGVLTVGKHKGLFFDEAMRLHPDYCVWAQSLTDPSPALSDFVVYLRDRGHARDNPDEEEASTRPTQRRKLDPCQCNICCYGVADHAIIPCGHVVCANCATKLRGACPFCRTVVERFVKLFLS